MQDPKGTEYVLMPVICESTSMNGTAGSYLNCKKLCIRVVSNAGKEWGNAKSNSIKSFCRVLTEKRIWVLASCLIIQAKFPTKGSSSISISPLTRNRLAISDRPHSNQKYRVDIKVHAGSGEF